VSWVPFLLPSVNGQADLRYVACIHELLLLGVLWDKTGYGQGHHSDSRGSHFECTQVLLLWRNCLVNKPPLWQSNRWYRQSIFVTCTLKLSIGTFLLRIVNKKSHIYLVYAMLDVVTSFCTVLFIMSIFQCDPVNRFVRYSSASRSWIDNNMKQWHPLAPGSCLDSALVLNMSYTHCAIIAMTDFGFAILPTLIVRQYYPTSVRGWLTLHQVWHLRMDPFAKISAFCLMGVGGL